jgi:uncharacterized phage protein (TIGR01671 family)
MREIKFRAWDGKTFTEFGPLFGLQSQLKPDAFRSHADSGFTISQFTGLKDNNGKEIYEGDVLDIDFGGYGEKNPWRVDWGAEHASFIILGKATDGDDEQLPFQLGNEANVVGNIYENPELLATTPNHLA